MLKCIDSPIEIQGHYDSNKARRFEIQFEKCTDRPTCKDDKEIIEWLRRKFIVVYQNQMSLDTKTEKGQVVEESTINWFPISTS